MKENYYILDTNKNVIKNAIYINVKFVYLGETTTLQK